jgi:hypothetical protein
MQNSKLEIRVKKKICLGGGGRPLSSEGTYWTVVPSWKKNGKMPSVLQLCKCGNYCPCTNHV